MSIFDLTSRLIGTAFRKDLKEKPSGGTEQWHDGTLNPKSVNEDFISHDA